MKVNVRLCRPSVELAAAAAGEGDERAPMTLDEQNYLRSRYEALIAFAAKLTPTDVDMQAACTGIVAPETVLQRDIAERVPAEVVQVIVQSAGMRDYLNAVIQAAVMFAVDVLGCLTKLACGFFWVFAFVYLKLNTEDKFTDICAGVELIIMTMRTSIKSCLQAQFPYESM